MAFGIPNEANATYARQAVPMSGDFDAIVASLNGSGVIESAGVTAGTGLSVSIAAGTVAVANRWNTVSAAANQSLTTADVTNPRLDAVVVNSSNVATIRTGTAAASPVPPTLSAGDILLAYVYVPANASSVVAGNIVDKRAIVIPSGTIYSAGAQSNITTIVTNQTLWTGVTIPANYLAAGDHFRLRAWLAQTTGTSPGNLTFRLLYGSTVLATTGAVARTASQTGRLIYIEADVYVINTTTMEAQGQATVNTSATASAVWVLGASAGTANTSTVPVGTSTAQVLTLDTTTTATGSTLYPRLIAVEMY